MSRRLLLHVGAPKTGTSLLQHALFTHRERLRDVGVLYPGDRPDAHFLAALDLMQLRWGGLEQQASGEWQRLVEAVRGWPGTAVVSHEIFGAATEEQAALALRALADDDTEVHLVLSARDLARQVPAEWQENVKHRRTKTYARFLDELRDPTRPTQVARWFWDVQDLPAVLDRWGRSLPPDRVHVVTVPRPGAPPTMLWDRFIEAFWLAGLDLEPEGRANASLGVPESAMLRRLNVRLNGGPDAGHDDTHDNHDGAAGGLDSDHYRTLVREMVVHRNLAGRPGSTKLVLPPALYEWATTTSSDWVDQLRARGYRVHGDLAELLVGEPHDYVDPDHGPEHAVTEAALDALAIMTTEAARLREVEQRLGEEVADQRAQLDRLYGALGYRIKLRLVALARTNAVARWGYVGYLRIRGRGSSSTAA